MPHVNKVGGNIVILMTFRPSVHPLVRLFVRPFLSPPFIRYSAFSLNFRGQLASWCYTATPIFSFWSQQLFVLSHSDRNIEFAISYSGWTKLLSAMPFCTPYFTFWSQWFCKGLPRTLHGLRHYNVMGKAGYHLVSIAYNIFCFFK